MRVIQMKVCAGEGMYMYVYMQVGISIGSFTKTNFQPCREVVNTS